MVRPISLIILAISLLARAAFAQVPPQISLSTGTGMPSIVDGVINAATYGAIGDAVYSGDGLHNVDGHILTSTTLSSPTISATTAMIGQAIFVDSAGVSSAAYIGTITAVNNSTHVMTVSPAFSTNIGISNATYAIGTDNTTALQNWINALRTAASTSIGPSGYVPLGNYFERGLDFTGTGGYKITGAGPGVAYTNPHRSGTNFLCILPSTNPNGGPSVCHDFTGNEWTTLRDMSFQSGVSTQSAGGVNFLLARKENGPRFAILNTIERIGFHAFGTYDVVNYSSEQNNWIDDFFNANGDPAIAYYLSQSNTPGFTSPYIGTLIGGGSTTINRFYGGATQFSAEGGAGTAFVIDGVPQDLSIDGAYVRLGGATDNFVTDTGTGSVCVDCSFNHIRVEADVDANSTTPSNQFVHFLGTWNGGTAFNDVMAWPSPLGGIAVQQPSIKVAGMASVHTANFQLTGGAPFTFPSPEVQVTTTFADSYLGNINQTLVQVPAYTASAGPTQGGVDTFSGVVKVGGLNGNVNNVANVRTYGAKGDGSDDSVAIKAARVAAGTTGTVYFPQGTYLWTDPTALQFGNNCNVSVFGDSPGTSILEPSFGSGDAISYALAGNVSPTDCRAQVKDLAFLPGAGATTNLKLIHISNELGITLAHLYAANFTAAGSTFIYLDTPGGTANFVERIVMDDIRSMFNTNMLVFDNSSFAATSLNNNTLTNSHCDPAGTGACVSFLNATGIGQLYGTSLQFNADLNTAGQSVFFDNHRADDLNGLITFQVNAQSTIASDNYCFNAPASTGNWTIQGSVECVGPSNHMKQEKNGNPVVFVPFQQGGTSVGQVDNINNWFYRGAHLGITRNTANPPVLSACGSSPAPTLSSLSNDSVGEVTFGGGSLTSCAIAFATPYAQNVACSITDDGQAIWYYLSAKSGSGFTVNGGNCPAGNCAGQQFTYQCFGVGAP